MVVVRGRVFKQQLEIIIKSFAGIIAIQSQYLIFVNFSKWLLKLNMLIHVNEEWNRSKIDN